MLQPPCICAPTQSLYIATPFISQATSICNVQVSPPICKSEQHIISGISTAKYQRCTVHFYRNILSVVPKQKSNEIAKMLKAIHAQEDKAAAKEKARLVTEKLRKLRLSKAADKVE